MNAPLKVGFIALGLIGGSIAKNIRKVFPDAYITALNRSRGTLDLAFEDGIIDHGTLELDDSFMDCDLIFLCAPVETNISYLTKLEPYLTPDTILTDVGSVKNVIHSAVSEKLKNAVFIGGHPMAGSEKSGYRNSSDRLIENAYYILTPGENAGKEHIDRYEGFVKALGAIPLVLEPSMHDRVTAAISHVPHMIAYTLVRLIEKEDSPEQYMKAIAAGGFKDITRIASSDPDMWEQICLENPDHMLELMDKYMEMLGELRNKISRKDGDALRATFEEAKNYRDSVQDAPLGPIKNTYVIHLDVEDEPGAIAIVATILSSHGLSLKNIGIVHNRIYEEGALRIEFYDQESMSLAIADLMEKGYRIFSRT
ncbi:MAG: prephenate dehydrogenase [Lachnospiraceae bacterium]|nr:prephenate dehydrogenase [Lachnospiraceae bacterium]